MRPCITARGPVSGCSSLLHWIVQSLQTLALSLLLLLPATDDGSAQDARRPSHHVYLIRGMMNVFSLGMDDLGEKLRKLGINASVHNHLAWPQLAAEAAENYKAGRGRTIILVGHSWGASAVADLAGRLGELGVPVRLAVELDPVWTTTASGRVGLFLNYYISDGAGKVVIKGAQFKGTLRNIDVKDYPNIGHMNIDKHPMVHQKVIGFIRSALAAERRPAGTANVSAGTGR
jgi:hypothetical protein